MAILQVVKLFDKSYGVPYLKKPILKILNLPGLPTPKLYLKELSSIFSSFCAAFFNTLRPVLLKNSG